MVMLQSSTGKIFIDIKIRDTLHEHLSASQEEDLGERKSA